MKSGVCPKCKSPNVFDGSNVPFKKGWSSQYTIKVSASSAATLDYYVCGDCGYVEGYVSTGSKLKRISEEWPRVRSGE